MWIAREEPYPRLLKMGRGTSCCASWRSLGGRAGLGGGRLGKERELRGRKQGGTISRVFCSTPLRTSGAGTLSFLFPHPSELGPWFFFKSPLFLLPPLISAFVFHSFCLQRSCIPSRGGYWCPLPLLLAEHVGLLLPIFAVVLDAFCGCCPRQGSL